MCIRDSRFVDGSDAFNDFTIARDEVSHLNKNEIVLLQGSRRDLLVMKGLSRHKTFCQGVPTRLAQSRCLRLAAAFSHGFSEIRKEQGNPEPKQDLESESQRSCFCPSYKVMQIKDCSQHTHHFDYEHDRVANHESRVEFAERIPNRRQNDRRVEQGSDSATRVSSLFH